MATAERVYKSRTLAVRTEGDGERLYIDGEPVATERDEQSGHHWVPELPYQRWPSLDALAEALIDHELR